MCLVEKPELPLSGFANYTYFKVYLCDVGLLIYDGDDSVVPVEVKAADNTQAKSYRIFCKRYSPQTGFKISRKNIAENFCENTCTINLPMYMTWNIKRYE